MKKTKQSHFAWFPGFPLQQIRPCVMKSAEHYDVKPDRGVPSKIFLRSHRKVQSHNPKRGCACREKKKESLISITQIVQGLNMFTSQNSITENGNRLKSLY